MSELTEIVGTTEVILIVIIIFIVIILFIAGIFISKYFLLVFIGFTFHLFLDILEEIHNNLRIDKISIIYDWFKFKKLKFWR